MLQVHTTTANYYAFCNSGPTGNTLADLWIVSFQLNVVYFPHNANDRQDVGLFCV